MYTGPDPTTETDDGRYIHAYPKVSYPSDVPALTDEGRIVVEEKLDGGNFRVRLDDTDRVYGSKKNIRGTTVSDFNAFFKRPARYIEDTVPADAQAQVVADYGPVTVFGENMLRHSLDYDWDSVPPFLVFDIYVHDREAFLPLEEARGVAATLDLEFAPVIEELTVDEFQSYQQPDADTDANAVSYPIPSSQYRDGPAEGVVFKNYTTQAFAKYVSSDFQEVNALRWGFTQRDDETGEGLREVDYTKFIVAKYVTDARIEKQLRKLVMDRGQLSMELMPDLLEAVYEDVWDEHGHDIIYSGETVELDRLHSLVADRCRHRLRAVVDNRDLIADLHDDLSDAEYLELMAIG